MFTYQETFVDESAVDSINKNILEFKSGHIVDRRKETFLLRGEYVNAILNVHITVLSIYSIESKSKLKLKLKLKCFCSLKPHILKS